MLTARWIESWRLKLNRWSPAPAGWETWAFASCRSSSSSHRKGLRPRALICCSSLKRQRELTTIPATLRYELNFSHCTPITNASIRERLAASGFGGRGNLRNSLLKIASDTHIKPKPTMNWAVRPGISRMCRRGRRTIETMLLTLPIVIDQLSQVCAVKWRRRILRLISCGQRAQVVQNSRSDGNCSLDSARSSAVLTKRWYAQPGRIEERPAASRVHHSTCSRGLDLGARCAHRIGSFDRRAGRSRSIPTGSLG